MKFIVTFLLVVIAVAKIAQSQKRVVCYYGTWAAYRHGNGAFNVENVDPKICTHLIYAFFGVTESGTIRITDPYLDLEENWGRGNIKKLNKLKLVNPQLKTLAAIGGWNEGSRKFSQVARNLKLRQSFAREAVSFCRQHSFDGIDIDWEYPGQRDGDRASDKDNFELLLAEIRKKFDPAGLLLTAAVSSAEFSASISYNIPKIARHLDFINVMSYDLHGPWDIQIGMNAPLYQHATDTTALQKQMNVNASVYFWLQSGAPRDKINLGMPLYGRTFTLRDTSQTTVGSFHSGPGLAGPYTNEPGIIGYNEFCEKQLTNHWLRRWESSQKVPYAYSGNQWVSYDDIESIGLKAKFVVDLNLGGAMVWSLETDDFRGICGQGKYPLVNTIRAVLQNRDSNNEPPIATTIENQRDTTYSSSTQSGTPSTTVQTTIATSKPSSVVTTKLNPPQPCVSDTIYGDSNDCKSYYKCSNGIQYQFNCPEPLFFDDISKTCNWEEDVKCRDS